MKKIHEVFLITFVISALILVLFLMFLLNYFVWSKHLPPPSWGIVPATALTLVVISILGALFTDV